MNVNSRSILNLCISSNGCLHVIFFSFFFLFSYSLFLIYRVKMFTHSQRNYLNYLALFICFVHIVVQWFRENTWRIYYPHTTGTINFGREFCFSFSTIISNSYFLLIGLCTMLPLPLDKESRILFFNIILEPLRHLGWNAASYSRLYTGKYRL
ncbi:hypothetical protein VIN7_9723 [Saccharomyces cerevisiae x Saccharomyces kudriavzevii VIN7]|uniref:Uncharacterized protein n=1 Tax=Saccharomyces cerevisiae x Saccharomyces kudriavzevii (strain VIN7) TaxID=1095631 RepID=H0H0M2_SACCK|nr:hypothetical protein VIN7_9723 [Saccharomyces cerevisiae x Saccharomyces kudriavzevii VIN7]